MLPLALGLLVAPAACRGRPSPPAAGVVRIVAIGDSITKGQREGVEADETFSALVESGLRRRGLPVQVVNAGVDMENSGAGLARFASDVVPLEPRIVTILYGTNDSFVDEGRTSERVSADEYRSNLVSLVERARSAGIVPVLMTEPRWGPRARNGLGENPNLRLEAYVRIVRDVARELDVPLVDHYADWLQLEERAGELTIDQCHPNPAGHRRMAALLEPVLAQLVAGESGKP